MMHAPFKFLIATVLALVVSVEVASSLYPSISLVPSAFAQNMRERIQQKAKQAQALIMSRAQTGQPVGDYLQRMEEAKKNFDRGDAVAGEAVLDGVIADLSKPSARTQAVTPNSPTEFGNPQPVEIRGYNAELGAMEPFISRDGQFLFFNNAADAFGAGKDNPDLHYARRVDDRTFEYLGKLDDASSGAMDGAASMDRDDNFYFTSVRSYDRDLQTLMVGRFADGRVRDLKFIPGEVSKRQRGVLNMDGEISADGETLYFSDNEWDTRNNIPSTSRLVIARKKNGAFVRDPRSDEILRTINADALAYAPATSADELEIFYTTIRFQKVGGKLAGAETAMFTASRPSRSDKFGQPKRIAAITGFVEGPTITSDGRTLYYHRKDGKIYKIYMVTRQKPGATTGR